jgi:hypothetical protein
MRSASSDHFKQPGDAQPLDWRRRSSPSTASRSIPQAVADTLGVPLNYQGDVGALAPIEA